MAWLARLLLIIPAMMVGWFVSREDPRFWVIAMAVALVFLALLCVVGIYFPQLSSISRRRDVQASDGER